MSSTGPVRTTWQEANNEHLAAALAWLRLRLQRFAAAPAAAPPAPPRERRGSEPSGRQQAADLTAAAEAMAAAEASEPRAALPLLAERLGLSEFERRVLLLCAAIELDGTVAALCARAQGSPHLPFPTFALSLRLFDEPAWDVLSPERPLRYWRLLEIDQEAPRGLTASPLRADERIVNFLKGLNYLDERLAPLLVPLDGDDLATRLPPSQERQAQTLLRFLRSDAALCEPPLVQLLGGDRESKRLLVRRVADELGLHPYRLPAALLPAAAGELEELTRLWQRESLLLPVALCVDARDSEEPAAAGHGRALRRFLARAGTLLFLDTRDVRPGLERPGLTLDVDKPTAAEQQSAWEEVLGPEAGDSPALLAGQFDLDLATLRRTARDALAETAAPRRGEAPSLHERLWGACLMTTRPRLDVLAQRIDPKATWDDLVLPDEQTALLGEVAGQVGQRSRVYDDWGFRRRMNRGLGISALFSGDSGTGKTMAAEVLANELRLNLYRIDLSAVVSKFIGETEKNLRRLFDAAEDGGAILFFDEADALFGKRSEVKDSHDRYANIEINYLLQRMEGYRGLAILATNMQSALDPAFRRRLRFIVHFPFPAAAEREAIWRRVFPPEAPLDGLDWPRLARFNLTGGHIHNIALNAAFRAARAGTAVTMPLLLEAARAEFRKLERPVNEAHFRWRRPQEAVA